MEESVTPIAVVVKSEATTRLETSPSPPGIGGGGLQHLNEMFLDEILSEARITVNYLNNEQEMVDKAVDPIAACSDNPGGGAGTSSIASYLNHYKDDVNNDNDGEEVHRGIPYHNNYLAYPDRSYPHHLINDQHLMSPPPPSLKQLPSPFPPLLNPVAGKGSHLVAEYNYNNNNHHSNSYYQNNYYIEQRNRINNNNNYYNYNNYGDEGCVETINYAASNRGHLDTIITYEQRVVTTPHPYDSSTSSFNNNFFLLGHPAAPAPPWFQQQFNNRTAWGENYLNGQPQQQISHHHPGSGLLNVINANKGYLDYNGITNTNVTSFSSSFNAKTLENYSTKQAGGYEGIEQHGNSGHYRSVNSKDGLKNHKSSVVDHHSNDDNNNNNSEGKDLISAPPKLLVGEGVQGSQYVTTDTNICNPPTPNNYQGGHNSGSTNTCSNSNNIPSKARRLTVKELLTSVRDKKRLVGGESVDDNSMDSSNKLKITAKANSGMKNCERSQSNNGNNSKHPPDQEEYPSPINCSTGKRRISEPLFNNDSSSSTQLMNYNNDVSWANQHGGTIGYQNQPTDLFDNNTYGDTNNSCFSSLQHSQLQDHRNHFKLSVKDFTYDTSWWGEESAAVADPSSNNDHVHYLLNEGKEDEITTDLGGGGEGDSKFWNNYDFSKNNIKVMDAKKVGFRKSSLTIRSSANTSSSSSSIKKSTKTTTIAAYNSPKDIEISVAHPTNTVLLPEDSWEINNNLRNYNSYSYTKNFTDIKTECDNILTDRNDYRSHHELSDYDLIDVSTEDSTNSFLSEESKSTYIHPHYDNLIEEILNENRFSTSPLPGGVVEEVEGGKQNGFDLTAQQFNNGPPSQLPGTLNFPPDGKYNLCSAVFHKPAEIFSSTTTYLATQNNTKNFKSLNSNPCGDYHHPNPTPTTKSMNYSHHPPWQAIGNGHHAAQHHTAQLLPERIAKFNNANNNNNSQQRQNARSRHFEFIKMKLGNFVYDHDIAKNQQNNINNTLFSLNPDNNNLADVLSYSSFYNDGNSTTVANHQQYDNHQTSVNSKQINNNSLSCQPKIKFLLAQRKVICEFPFIITWLWEIDLIMNSYAAHKTSGGSTYGNIAKSGSVTDSNCIFLANVEIDFKSIKKFNYYTTGNNCGLIVNGIPRVRLVHKSCINTATSSGSTINTQNNDINRKQFTPSHQTPFYNKHEPSFEDLSQIHHLKPLINWLKDASCRLETPFLQLEITFKKISTIEKFKSYVNSILPHLAVNTSDMNLENLSSLSREWDLKPNSFVSIGTLSNASEIAKNRYLTFVNPRNFVTDNNRYNDLYNTPIKNSIPKNGQSNFGIPPPVSQKFDTCRGSNFTPNNRTLQQGNNCDEPVQYPLNDENLKAKRKRLEAVAYRFAKDHCKCTSGCNTLRCVCVKLGNPCCRSLDFDNASIATSDNCHCSECRNPLNTLRNEMLYSVTIVISDKKDSDLLGEQHKNHSDGISKNRQSSNSLKLNSIQNNINETNDDIFNYTNKSDENTHMISDIEYKCRTAKNDSCLMQNIYQIMDLKERLNNVIELPCCHMFTPLKNCIPGLVKCPNQSCSAKFKYSWCLAIFFEQTLNPRNHCEVCRRCTNSNYRHCYKCNRCYFRNKIDQSCTICYPPTDHNVSVTETK